MEFSCKGRHKKGVPQKIPQSAEQREKNEVAEQLRRLR